MHLDDAYFRLWNGQIQAYVLVTASAPTSVVVIHDNGTGVPNYGVSEDIPAGQTELPITVTRSPDLRPYPYNQTIPYLDVWIDGEAPVRVWPVGGNS